MISALGQKDSFLKHSKISYEEIFTIDFFIAIFIVSKRKALHVYAKGKV